MALQTNLMKSEYWKILLDSTLRGEWEYFTGNASSQVT